MYFYILEIKALLVISYTKKETLETDCKQTIPFNHIKKYLGVNLTKEVKDLYAKNHKH